MQYPTNKAKYKEKGVDIVTTGENIQTKKGKNLIKQNKIIKSIIQHHQNSQNQNDKINKK